ncbi:hypothetical protein N2152v2_001269 [Parachlorella kessleri]
MRVGCQAHVLKESYTRWASRQALAKLYTPDGSKARYPLAFLTNGGGVSEERKAEQLSEWLSVHVIAPQVVLSHTPFKQLVPALGDKPVLISGRGHVADVARKYSELQIMMDVLTSKGVPGRRHTPQAAPPVEVFFSNPDLLWANEFPTPRFGQGAFAACLEALHEKMTGVPLQAKRVFGKPNPKPYELIEDLLLQQARELGMEVGSPSGELPFSSIYAVGDNPAADVRGANRAGHPWVSVLVKTGVFDGTLYANCPNDPAHMVVDDVEAAVDAVLHRHRSARWHSMR